MRDVKSVLVDLLEVQRQSLGNNDYMAGMYNGMVVVYNSLKDEGLIDSAAAKEYCHNNKSINRWEA